MLLFIFVHFVYLNTIFCLQLTQLFAIFQVPNLTIGNFKLERALDRFSIAFYKVAGLIMDSLKKGIKVPAAEPEILSFIFHASFFVTKACRLHYHSTDSLVRHVCVLL